MQFYEKMQYKLRNFLYEQERQREYKKQNTSGTDTKTHAKTNTTEDTKVTGKVKMAIDEMDTYLEEKIKDMNWPKIK